MLGACPPNLFENQFLECSIPIPVPGKTGPSSENVHSNPQIDDCTSCCIPFSSKFLIFPTGGSARNSGLFVGGDSKCLDRFS